MMLADQTIDQLLETALWQAGPDEDGTGEPYDWNYSVSDFEPDSRSDFIAQFRAFVNANPVTIDAYMAHTARGMDDVAHDYVLTRNGHGTGFWDRCYCGKDRCYAGDTLTTAVKAEGEFTVYSGDDGRLYIS